MRKPRLILSLAALASSLVLAASLAIPASAATRTGSSTGQLVATGTVTASSGKAMPGAKVSLYAWPSSAVLQGLHPNQDVPRKLLATTTADSKGQFSFRVQPAALAAAAVSSGNANLEADSGTAMWFFVQKASATTPPTSVNLLNATPDECLDWTFIRQLDQRWGTVGQSYDPHATHITQGFTYGTGQSSTISVGVTAADGVTYHFGGKVSISTNSGEGFPSIPKPSNNLYQTHFKIAKYKKVCVEGTGMHSGTPRVPGSRASASRPMSVPKAGAATASRCISCQTYHMVRSNAWAGGEQLMHPAHAPTYSTQDCQPFLGSPGDPGNFHTQNATAITWTASAGLQVKEVKFNLSISTGYSTTAKITYSFTANRSVCGSNNAPTQAQRTIARN
jgi:hypothetical protein